jgi:hypothetical protein
MKRVISLSIPRSGHHLLVRLVHSYFEHGKFLYCEAYTDPECCGRFPCDAVSQRAKSTFGRDSDLRLFMQKSHDLKFEVPVNTTAQYIVQLREPAQAAIALLRWEMTHGSRENFSLGEIPGKAFDFFCYYIRFYHKWCVPAIVGSRERDIHLIHYESLVHSREDTRNGMLRLLDFLNLPIDDFRLEYSLENSLNRDSHTGEARSQDAWNREIEYYDRLCGGSFSFLVEKVAAFCPGLPVAQFAAERHWATSDWIDQQMGKLFFPLDLSSASDATLDFRISERRLQRDSLAVDTGYPSMNRALGLTYGEKGSGAWTLGDNVMFPFKISASPQIFRGELVVVNVDGKLDLSKILALTAVIQGSFATVAESFSTRNGRTTLAFNFSVPGGTSSATRNSVLILTIARPVALIDGISRSMNLLLDSLSLSSNCDKSKPALGTT